MKSFVKICSVICLVLVLVNIRTAHGQFLFFQSPLVGKDAPVFELQTVKGETLSLSDFRQGKDTILFFWATWCPHCREAIRDLGTSFSEIQAKGIKVGLVDIGEDADTVKGFLQKRGMTDVVTFLDARGTVSEDYKVIGVPSFIFIGENGEVKAVKNSLPKKIEQIFQSN